MSNLPATTTSGFLETASSIYVVAPAIAVIASSSWA